MWCPIESDVVSCQNYPLRKVIKMLPEPIPFDDVKPLRGRSRIREVRALVSRANGYGASDVHDTPDVGEKMQSQFFARSHCLFGGSESDWRSLGDGRKN